MTVWRTVFMALVAFLALQSQARATILTFSDKGTFLAATGAANATGGPLPDLGFIPSGVQTVGSVTFSIAPPSSALFIGAAGVGGVPGGDWTPIHPGADIAISDVENLNAALAAPVFSAGFDFVEPSDTASCDAPCFDSTFTVTLLNGGTLVDSFTFNAPDDTLAFVGVWSDQAFDRLEIRDTTATIDDEFFGEFYTGTSPLRPVPEPGTLLLLGSGLAGLGGVAWRRRHRR